MAEDEISNAIAAGVSRGLSSALMSSPENTDAAARLCTVCGLCCNGVLFHIVRLQPTDSAKQLEARGMKLSRKKREPYFKQPCSFLTDCTCTQYAARPLRCRLFECRQLKRLADLEITEADALRSIDEVKRSVARVELLLEQSGNTDAHLPMSERYAQVLASGAASVHRDLIEEMSGLNAALNENFRLEPEELRQPSE